MTRTPVPRVGEDLPALRDDPLAPGHGLQGLHWNGALVWFMRLLAVLWIFKGLLLWATILGAINAPLPFEGSAGGYQATVIYFAVLDIVAGVGLWLTAGWGGILWLFAVTSHLILAVFFPRYVSNGAVLIGLFIAAIMIYLTISWLASIEEH